MKQAQLKEKQENQNVTKNYASVWKKKVDRQKSIRSLELEKLKNIQKTNQDQTENSIEIQSPETTAHSALFCKICFIFYVLLCFFHIFLNCSKTYRPGWICKL